VGGIIGTFLTTTIIAYYCIIALLIQWGYVTDTISSISNLLFFLSLQKEWAMVVVVVLSCIMSQARVTALQTGIIGSLLSTSTTTPRRLYNVVVMVLLLLLSAPVVVAALQGFVLTDITHLIHLLTTICFLPILSSLFLPYPSTTTTTWVSIILSLLSTIAFGVGYYHNYIMSSTTTTTTDGGTILLNGLKYTFYRTWNHYDYRLYVVAVGSSLLLLLLGNLTFDRRFPPANPLPPTGGGSGGGGGSSSNSRRCCGGADPVRPASPQATTVVVVGAAGVVENVGVITGEGLLPVVAGGR